MNRLPLAPCRRSRRHERRAGFTLLEMLAVITIMLLLLVLARPAFSSMLIGTNLSRAGQMVGDEIGVARQEAVARNSNVEFRIYNLDGTAKGWRGMQIWRIEQSPTGTVSVPARRFVQLPEGVSIDAGATLSPLLGADPSVAGTATVPGFGSVSYQGFRFRANGATSTSVSDGATPNNFLTVQNSNQADDATANYYTLQVNPITGKIAIFRP